MTQVPEQARCSYVVDEEGLSHWPQTHRDAWIGFLQTHRQLVRELDAELEAAHGLTVNGLELLGRLAAADDRVMGLSTLADQTGLSLSRVSRMIDLFGSRGLVERLRCPGDRRARNAHLTDAGLELVRAAQRTHFASVQRRFFDRLEPDELSALASAFARFAPGAADACTTSD